MGSISMAPPQPLSEFPFYLGLGYPDGATSTTVSVDDVELHYSENSAGFTAEVLVCTQRPVPEGTVNVGATAASEGDLSEYCTSVRPIRNGTRMSREKESGDYFVAVLTPTRAGTAHLDRVDITYARGARQFFQRGTQHVSQDVRFAVKR